MAMRWLAPVLLLAAFGPADGVGAGLRSARARRSLRAGAGVAADVDADTSSSSATVGYLNVFHTHVEVLNVHVTIIASTFFLSRFSGAIFTFAVVVTFIRIKYKFFDPL